MRTTMSPYGHDLYQRLHATTDLSTQPLHAEAVTEDVGELALESYMQGILSGKLFANPDDEIEIRFRPVWGETQPLVEGVEIELVLDGGKQSYRQLFRNGRWVRRAELRVAQLRAQGQLEQGQVVYRSLAALEANGRGPKLEPPVLEMPPIEDRTREELGIQSLGTGGLDAERPILINQSMEEDISRRTREAGKRETGGACLGQFARLPEPLPGTLTQIVTVLAASVCDNRHVGDVAQWKISPDALAEAAELAAISETPGQRVMTCWHSHGFCNELCEKQDECPLVGPASFSLNDYQVAETLFPSKATVLPICGRQPTQPAPVLVVHGWRDGLVQPLRWMRYED